MKSGLTKALLATIIIAGIIYGVLQLMVPEAVVATARTGKAVQAVTGNVTLEPLKETQILSTGNGFLHQSKFHEGMSVKMDVIYGTLDPDQLPFQVTDIRLKIKNTKQQLEQGSPKRFELETLRRTLAQQKELVEENFISKADYNKQLTAANELESQIQLETERMESELDQYTNELKKLEDALDRLSIKAPFEGLITKVHAFPGDLLRTGDPIATIISHTVRIKADVNQDDIAYISPGAPANIRFFAYGDEEFDAEVTQIIPNSDAATQRFTVYLKLLSRPDDLLPGVTGEVSFFAGEKNDTLIIPRRALQGNNVLVVNDKNIVEVRKVEKGFNSYVEVEILSGLKEGERVIVEDLDLFRKDEKVKPVPQVIEEDN